MFSLRKKNIVDKNLQYQVIGAVLASGASVCIIMLVGIKLMANHLLNVIESNSMSSEMTIYLLDNLGLIFNYLVLFVFISLLVSWMFALYLSNRIAGPVFNITRVLTEYLEGKPEAKSRIRIRRTDFFIGLVEKINAVLESKNQPQVSKNNET